ncbi:MAG: LysR family transcriptional regulator [Clostridia bacterium]|nr:LysR family transcriptional regulator [Clostridia bacterium]
MNTKNVETFIALSQYNSFNAAAEALFLSPPALQQQVNRLEADVGFKLFERSVSGIRLTPAGETFLDGILKIRSDIDLLLTRCRETESRSNCIRIGAIVGLQPDLFPRLSGPFFQQYPDVIQKPVMETEDQLLNDLDRGALDVVEYYDCPRAHAAGRIFVPLIVEGRDAMMSPNHPLASRKSLTLEDLRGQHIIVYRFERLPGLREFIGRNYPDIRISEDPRMMDFYTMVRTFEDGHIGLLPPHVGSQFLPLRTVPLRMGLTWATGLVYREPSSLILRNFIDVARQVFRPADSEA